MYHQLTVKLKTVGFSQYYVKKPLAIFILPFAEKKGAAEESAAAQVDREASIGWIGSSSGKEDYPVDAFNIADTG